MVIKDRDGRMLFELESYRDGLDSMDLRNADFADQQLEGVFLCQSDLRGADFTGADLYWALAAEANFEGAILCKAQCNGADFQDANLRNADLRDAYISFDNLGGCADLRGADLTDANLEGTDLRGTEYNDQTRFPKGFDPVGRGMVWVDPRRHFVRIGSFESEHLAPGYHIREEKR